MPLCAFVSALKCGTRSSYEDGCVSGLSPKLMRLLGEDEYPVPFFVPSCTVEDGCRANLADDSASRSGEAAGMVDEGAGSTDGNSGDFSGDLSGVL